MKGTLHKNKVEGWLVLYTVEETWDRCIPIHPDYEKYYFLDDDADGKEVEFEIVQVAVDNNGTVVNYSRLIKPSVDKLGNEDVPKLGYDVDKFATEWIDENSNKWSNNTDEVGDNYGSFVAGYNKAKSTLYTEEQMVDLLKFVIESKSGLTSEEFRKASYSFMVKKFIQSLKQPKK